ncbi:TrkA family potassium uptake protein [Sulfurovum sp.]|uniref:potassium channel family protein n=1 Tax=Sulfurovum sp. TaxID=1969726 RepID=UPI0025DF7C42|nr:NAD-binding protein [Sulfurovum sp.]
MYKKNKIVLFGYGVTGRQLYKKLIEAGNSVRVISGVDDKVEQGTEENVNIIKVNIKHNRDIHSLDIDPKNELIYCGMSRTATNLFLVLTLRALYREAVIVSVSNSSESTRKLKYAGANSVIDLYDATARRTVNSMTKPAVTKVLDEIVYRRNDLRMAEVEIEENSVADGIKLSEIDFQEYGIVLIALIDRELGDELIFSYSTIDHHLDKGDVLVVVGKIKNLKYFQEYYSSPRVV